MIFFGANLADMQLSKFTKRIHFLLSGIDVYGKYTWVTSLMDNKAITITYYFYNIRWIGTQAKHNMGIWGDKGSKFYNKSMKTSLEDNGIEIDSKGKSVVF